MRSKLAEASREELVEICRRMTPAERLQAFVSHSKVLAEIYWAGEATRREQRLQSRQPRGINSTGRTPGA